MLRIAGSIPVDPWDYAAWELVEMMHGAHPEIKSNKSTKFSVPIKAGNISALKSLVKNG